MRTLAVAVALALTIPGLAAAQESVPPKSAPPESAPLKAKPAVTGKKAPDAATAGSGHLDADHDKARLAAEARQRAWDRKMKSLTRSICSGAKGC